MELGKGPEMIEVESRALKGCRGIRDVPTQRGAGSSLYVLGLDKGTGAQRALTVVLDHRHENC